VVAICDDVVCVVAVVMMPGWVLVGARMDARSGVPVEGKEIARDDFDGVGGWDIAHDVAAQINGVEVFDGAVVVAAFAGCAVVSWSSNALGRALIYAIDIDALRGVSVR
jgi:hypothetical protein